MELVYALVNEGNIKTLTKELLDYLQVSDVEFKPDLTSKICMLVQRFAPDKQWHLDSLLQVCSSCCAPLMPKSATLCAAQPSQTLPCTLSSASVQLGMYLNLLHTEGKDSRRRWGALGTTGKALELLNGWLVGTD